MSTLSGLRYARYREAYLLMANEADYRPQAPSDGMGHILLSREQVADKDRLEQEATAYAWHSISKKTRCHSASAVVTSALIVHLSGLLKLREHSLVGLLI
jgi:hypothetical protein